MSTGSTKSNNVQIRQEDMSQQRTGGRGELAGVSNEIGCGRGSSVGLMIEPGSGASSTGEGDMGGSGIPPTDFNVLAAGGGIEAHPGVGAIGMNLNATSMLMGGLSDTVMGRAMNGGGGGLATGIGGLIVVGGNIAGAGGGGGNGLGIDVAVHGGSTSIVRQGRSGEASGSNVGNGRMAEANDGSGYGSSQKRRASFRKARGTDTRAGTGDVRNISETHLGVAHGSEPIPAGKRANFGKQGPNHDASFFSMQAGSDLSIPSKRRKAAADSSGDQHAALGPTSLALSTMQHQRGSGIDGVSSTHGGISVALTKSEGGYHVHGNLRSTPSSGTADGPAETRSAETRSCQFPSCRRGPCYGLEGDKRATFCSQHRLPGMVNVVSPRCAHEGCRLGPSYNEPGEKKPMFCSGHRLPGMVNVVSPRCHHLGCARGPSYGHDGDRKAIFCSGHRLHGMVNVVSPRCIEDGCQKGPSYGFEGSRSAFCAKHKREGMVNVVSPRCHELNCLRGPRYGLPNDRKPSFCAKHKHEGMINIASRKLSARSRRESELREAWTAGT